MKKQPEITAATRAAFIDAYYDLAKKKPHNKITIQELSTKAGYNRTTFYEYFNNIDHVLSTIEDEMLECIKSKVITRFGKTELDVVFVATFSELYTEYDKPLRLLFNRANAPVFSEKIKNTLIPIITEQIGDNLHNAETVFILEFYLSGVISVVSKWFSDENELSLDEFAHIMKTIVDGMRKSGLFQFL